MTPNDILDDIISKLEPEDVPVEFIIAAKITDMNGEERIIKGAELEHVLHNPKQYPIAEARILFNVRKIRKAIVTEVNAIYDAVNARMKADVLGGRKPD